MEGFAGGGKMRHTHGVWREEDGPVTATAGACECAAQHGKGTLKICKKVKDLEIGIQSWIVRAGDILMQFSNGSFLLYFYVFGVRCIYQRVHVKVREHLAGVSFLLLLGGLLGSNSSCQA